jgi:hypothetical protein
MVKVFKQTQLPALILILLLPIAVSSVAEPPPTTEVQASSPDNVPQPSGNWLDRSHATVADSGDALANWLDNFFGTRDSDIDSARSLVRMSAIYEADELESDGFKYKIRGKLRLPNLKKRFYIIFTGNDEDEDEELLDPPEDDEDENQVGLQYQLKENGPSRINFFGTVNSGFKYKVGGRYRYEISPTDNFQTRFSEELAYQQSDHLISTTRLDLSYNVRADRLLRWASRVRYGQKTEGVEWNTQLGWQQRIAATKAISYFVGVDGNTDQSKTIDSYGPGVRYRQNIFRKYLFVDVGTAYGWRKSADDTKREGAWSFEVQFQMFFENQRTKKI